MTALREGVRREESSGICREGRDRTHAQVSWHNAHHGERATERWPAQRVSRKECAAEADHCAPHFAARSLAMSHMSASPRASSSRQGFEPAGAMRSFSRRAERRGSAEELEGGGSERPRRV